MSMKQQQHFFFFCFSFFENNPLLKLIKLENKKKILSSVEHWLAHSLTTIHTVPKHTHTRSFSFYAHSSRIYSLKYFLSNTIISLCVHYECTKNDGNWCMKTRSATYMHTTLSITFTKPKCVSLANCVCVCV